MIGDNLNPSRDIEPATGFKPGDTVNIYYAHGDYLPHPSGPVAVVLAKGTNTQNLQLMKNTRKAAYWATWANRVKSYVDTHTAVPSRRSDLYNESWSSLGILGFSSAAQAQAARQLSEMTPETPHSRQLMSFAAVDLDTLEQADSGIRLAIRDQGKLSTEYSIPPDVAVAIAASELAKAKSTPPRSEFMKSFEEIWGKNATNELSKAVSSPSQRVDVDKMWGKTEMMANQPKPE